MPSVEICPGRIPILVKLNENEHAPGNHATQTTAVSLTLASSDGTDRQQAADKQRGVPRSIKRYSPAGGERKCTCSPITHHVHGRSARPGSSPEAHTCTSSPTAFGQANRTSWVECKSLLTPVPFHPCFPLPPFSLPLQFDYQPNVPSSPPLVLHLLTLLPIFTSLPHLHSQQNCA